MTDLNISGAFWRTSLKFKLIAVAIVIALILIAALAAYFYTRSGFDERP